MVRHSTNKYKKYYKIIPKIEYFLILVTIFIMNIALINNNFAFANTTNEIDVLSYGSSEILMEVNSGRILEGKNYDKSLPMASTTKIMTALVVIENEKLDKLVTIPKAAVGVEGSSIYLKEGEKLTVEELLYGLMLRSGNDAATALALTVGKSMEGFVDMMNNKAKNLGLENTHFTNPHGLHDDNHYTSAYDLGIISCESMKNSTFKKIASTKNITINGEDYKRPLQNKNKILFNYDGGTGIKTGYTKKAGRCLVASSERNGLEVVSVVLNIPDMFERCSYLMDYAHNNYEYAKIVDKTNPYKDIVVKKGKIESFIQYPDKDIYYPIKKDGSDNVKITCELPEIVTAPKKKGEIIGNIDISVNNRLIFSEKIYNIKDIEKKGVLDKIKDFFS